MKTWVIRKEKKGTNIVIEKDCVLAIEKELGKGKELKLREEMAEMEVCRKATVALFKERKRKMRI